MRHFIPENINISQAHENEGENGHFTETFYKGANLDSACFSSTHNFLPIFYLIITSLNFLVIQTMSATEGASGVQISVSSFQTLSATVDRKSTRLNSSHVLRSRMPSSA